MSLIETKMSTFGRNFRHWLQRSLQNDNLWCGQWRKFRHNQYQYDEVVDGTDMFAPLPPVLRSASRGGSSCQNTEQCGFHFHPVITWILHLCVYVYGGRGGEWVGGDRGVEGGGGGDVFTSYSL